MNLRELVLKYIGEQAQKGNLEEGDVSAGLLRKFVVWLEGSEEIQNVEKLAGLVAEFVGPDGTRPTAPPLAIAEIRRLAKEIMPPDTKA